MKCVYLCYEPKGKGWLLRLGVPDHIGCHWRALTAIDPTWVLLPLSKPSRSYPFHEEVAPNPSRRISQLMAFGLWPPSRVLWDTARCTQPQTPTGRWQVGEPPAWPQVSRCAGEGQSHAGVGWAPQPGPAALPRLWHDEQIQSPPGMNTCGGRFKFHSLALLQISTSFHKVEPSEVVLSVCEN